MFNGAWMRQRRKELGLSLTQLAELVGLSKSTVYKYETGEIQKIGFDRVETFARALHTSPAFLLGWAGSDASNLMEPPRFRGKPRLGTIACGVPILAMQNIETFDPVPDYADCDFTLLCRGDSMTGAHIRDGDLVCIRRQDTAETGQIAAVLVDGEFEAEATLKRVRHLENGIALWPENPAYEPLIFLGEEANRVHILGVATYCIGKI